MATRRTAHKHGAAALAEQVCGHDDRAALHARHLLAVHSLVLGRIAFAFSTKVIRSHTSVASCASARYALLHSDPDAFSSKSAP